MTNCPVRISSTVVALVLAFSLVQLASAQPIAVGTPFTGVTDSYYERNGINFGFSLPAGRGTGSRVVGLSPTGQLLSNITFGQGGFNSAIPQFGGYDPNSGLRTGFALLSGNGGRISLGLEFGKGSSRTLSSQTPTVVMQNGGYGSVFNGSFRPFVTGLTPVSGAGYRNGVLDAIHSGQLDLSGLGQAPGSSAETAGELTYSNPSSSATTGDLSVAEIRARNQSRRSARLEKFQARLREALEFEEVEDIVKAKMAYREAMNLCEDPEMKQRIKTRLRELRSRD